MHVRNFRGLAKSPTPRNSPWTAQLAITADTASSDRGVIEHTKGALLLEKTYEHVKASKANFLLYNPCVYDVVADGDLNTILVFLGLDVKSGEDLCENEEKLRRQVSLRHRRINILKLPCR